MATATLCGSPRAMENAGAMMMPPSITQRAPKSPAAAPAARVIEMVFTRTR